jgi:hypothetical protein
MRHPRKRLRTSTTPHDLPADPPRALHLCHVAAWAIDVLVRHGVCEAIPAAAPDAFERAGSRGGAQAGTAIASEKSAAPFRETTTLRNPGSNAIGEMRETIEIDDLPRGDTEIGRDDCALSTRVPRLVTKDELP